MGLFDKLREPVVLKEDSSAKKQLEQLDFYSKLAPESVKEQIEQDKKLVYYGIKGEEALMFELKNSHMPMYILHDIFFEENGLTTQIDY
ncbi:nuclease-related domain-containing protein, partial [Ruminococcus sp.]